jgi:hypothetical protein
VKRAWLRWWLPVVGLAPLGSTGRAAGDDGIQVAAYYFPNWGPVERSEWKSLQAAVPRFEGHLQPKVPAWGYGNENDPAVMARKIDAAADHGIDAFIFDWYYYDAEQSGGAGLPETWDGSKYLFRALEEGFLGAPNHSRLKFAVMWCNHDLGGKVKGAVQPQTFDALCDYVIEKYFKHPLYWKIDGCPYFSIYQLKTFLESFGGDRALAAEALERFRGKVRAAGFPDLHLNVVLFGLGGPEMARKLRLDSTTSYVWIHHWALPDFPATDYGRAADAYFHSLDHGGAANGLEKPASSLPVPYHPNVSMGWDASPRCDPQADWMNKRGYPYGAVIVNNTPERFRGALARARDWVRKRPRDERILTLNSWNEWGEGSYLEPDTVHGTGYLEAVRSVFRPGGGSVPGAGR